MKKLECHCGQVKAEIDVSDKLEKIVRGIPDTLPSINTGFLSALHKPDSRRNSF